MLINDFYTCDNIHENANEYSCRITFNAAHAIFKGHFPDHPVVPGVCMMEILKELLQKQVGKPLMLHNASNVKFLQLMTPATQPVIKIGWKEHEEGYTVNATFISDPSVHFKLSGHYITLKK